jgi:glutamate synthase (NADPH/NADH) small chain
MQGCPLGNPIPDFNDLVYRDRFLEAHRALAATNNFPEFTGRLCPAPCEAACTLAINREAVTIEQIEKQIIERAFAEGWVEPQPPDARSGKTVAVVGSGPAGLAAAAQLNRAGHLVTVYERDDRIGGLLRYGIPDFKMEKQVLDRRLEVLAEEGVVFQPGAPVGEAPTWGKLATEHDAVLIAIGSRRPRDLPVPGRDLDGVVFAMEYLEQQNRVVAGDIERAPLNAEGKRVIILGGGDTGSDCLGTAHRQGAAHVHQIELFPMPPAERSPGNPWPFWPRIFSTSSSQQEGGDRVFAFMTKRLLGEGRLEALEGVEISLENGKIVEHPDRRHHYDVDLLILAMGFVGPDTEELVEQLGVELDGRGNVSTDERMRTSVANVFAAGDARRGQSLIVWAIAEGREAAHHIDAQLRDAPSVLHRPNIAAAGL